VVKIVGLIVDERSTVQRTARRGPFLTVARARERIAIYINGYSNITHRAQKERQGRPEQTPRVNSKKSSYSGFHIINCIENIIITPYYSTY